VARPKPLAVAGCGVYSIMLIILTRKFKKAEKIQKESISMRTKTGIGSRALFFGLVVLIVSLPAYSDEAAENVKEIAELWGQMRRMDVNAPRFASTRQALLEVIGNLPEDQKVAVATAMMERGADDAINATALQLFGQAGLPAKDMGAILYNSNRTWPQRVFVRTYYKFIRPENETMLTEPARRELVRMLAGRLRQLVGQEKISYGEQRLVSHMLQAALSRYAGKKGSVSEMADLDNAMVTYAARKRDDDVLAASIKGWLEMKPAPKIDSVETAMKNLGHWDPLVRGKASVLLGTRILKEPAVAEKVLAIISGARQDPRDEVRAAGAAVFSFALSYKPEKIIPEMVKLLVWDRGVTVQKSAAETLIAHSDEAQITINLLLDALEKRRPSPGPKRATSILQTLSYLVNPDTPAGPKQRLRDIAVQYISFAPAGALRALEALGPFAKPVVGDIIKYRDAQADRFTRQYINRHVLQAIDPSITGG